MMSPNQVTVMVNDISIRKKSLQLVDCGEDNIFNEENQFKISFRYDTTVPAAIQVFVFVTEKREFFTEVTLQLEN